jgi:heme-transporting ATPase
MRYDDRVLFDGLSFAADKGCYALEDEHGSGKSTFLRVVAGAAAADAGEVRVGGRLLNPASHDAATGLFYVPEDFPAYPVETGRAFLERIATDRQTALDDGIFALADAFGLTPHLDKRFEQMSFGTRKKFFFTAAAIGHVDVVIADEPTSGLDAPSRAVLAELFATLAEDRLVFFTSYDEQLVRASKAKVVSFDDLEAG